jgi:hypothetical protein
LFLKVVSLKSLNHLHFTYSSVQVLHFIRILSVWHAASVFVTITDVEIVEIHIVACLLKARIVKPAETAVAREQLCQHTGY